MDWIEVSLGVDGEAAEAVADLLARYGHQGVAIEQAGFPVEVWPDEIPPADRLIVRAYFPADERAEAAQQQLREALGTKVTLSRSRQGGRLVVYFYSEEELQALYERMIGGG